MGDPGDQAAVGIGYVLGATGQKRCRRWGRKMTLGHLIRSSLGFGSMREQSEHQAQTQVTCLETEIFLLDYFLPQKCCISFLYSLPSSGTEMSLPLCPSSSCF